MGKKKFVKEYLEPIVIAILIALFIRAFIVQAFKIPSASMEPTLTEGDHLLVSKFIYGIRIPFGRTKFFKYKNPKRGDVIVFIYPKDRSKDYIKRVIATAGEKVDIIANKIYINNKLIDDPWGHYIKIDWMRYLEPPERYGPVIVPKDSLFVLGDNRNNSQDSRVWGFVNINDVRGKALIIYFSWNGKTTSLLDKIRWERLCKIIR
jgi:signal peptidase I